MRAIYQKLEDEFQAKDDEIRAQAVTIEEIEAKYQAVVAELEEAQSEINLLANHLWARLYNEAIYNGYTNAEAKAYADKLGKGEL